MAGSESSYPIGHGSYPGHPQQQQQQQQQYNNNTAAGTGRANIWQLLKINLFQRYWQNLKCQYFFSQILSPGAGVSSVSPPSSPESEDLVFASETSKGPTTLILPPINMKNNTSFTEAELKAITPWRNALIQRLLANHARDQQQPQQQQQHYQQVTTTLTQR